MWLEDVVDVAGDRWNAAVEARRGKPMQQIVERQAALTSFLLDRADEARGLSHRIRAA
jgi:hypothetical protein